MKGEFLYKGKTKLHIKITQHDDAYFNVFKESTERQKISFLKRNCRNFNLLNYRRRSIFQVYIILTKEVHLKQIL